MRAELSYLVPLEDVVLADPVQLGGRVVAHLFHLERGKVVVRHLGFLWSFRGSSAENVRFFSESLDLLVLGAV